MPSRYIRFAAQTRNQSFYELRFAGAKVSGQGDHRALLDSRREFAAESPGLLRATGNERSHWAILDFGFWIFDLAHQRMSVVISGTFCATHPPTGGAGAARSRRGVHSLRRRKSRL